MDTENRGVEFYPPEEADRQPWNDLPDSPQDSGQPPTEPKEPVPVPADAGTPRTVPLLAYLTALLAAGLLLMTAVCVLQFRDSQRELDEVRGALENVQAVDQLQMEKAQLQERIDELTAAAEETAQEMQELQASLVEKVYAANISGIEKDMLNYLWFIQNFMESGNYAMAANAVAYSGDHANYLYFIYADPPNQRQYEQYQEYCQRLVELGYLNSIGYTINLADGTRSSRGIGSERVEELNQWLGLWAGLKEYYIEEDMMEAAHYLIEWSKHQELIEQHRGSFAIDQYELLLERLVNDGFLFETESGGLNYGPRFYEDGITNDAYDDGPTPD